MPAEKVPLSGLKELVGFGKETLNGLASFEAFLLGFLFRATRTQGPKAFDFDSAFFDSLALYGQLSALCPT